MSLPCQTCPSWTSNQSLTCHLLIRHINETCSFLIETHPVQKKTDMSIHFVLPGFTNHHPSSIINHHQPSSTIINHHRPSSTIINHHQPSSTIHPMANYSQAVVLPNNLQPEIICFIWRFLKAGITLNHPFSEYSIFKHVQTIHNLGYLHLKNTQLMSSDDVELDRMSWRHRIRNSSRRLVVTSAS